MKDEPDELPNNIKIRSHLKKELLDLKPSAYKNLGPFTVKEIEDELNRREEIYRRGPYHS